MRVGMNWNNRATETNNEAIIGDKISFLYYGLPSVGVVRKVLVNSVITSLQILDTTTEEYEKVRRMVDIPEETVINYRRYQIESWEI